jgi:subtilisin family serine protease
MATPHVAGVAALYLEVNSGATPAQVTQAILGTATAGVIGNPGRNSPNLLLYSLFGSPGTGDPGNGGTAGEATVTLGTGIVASTNKKFWKAAVPATARDGSGTLIAGATVSGTFDPGGSSSCVTGSDGSCTLTSGNIPLGTATTFTLSGVSGYSLSVASDTKVTIESPAAPASR